MIINNRIKKSNKIIYKKNYKTLKFKYIPKKSSYLTRKKNKYRK